MGAHLPCPARTRVARGHAEPSLDPMLAWEIGEPRGHLLHHVLQGSYDADWGPVPWVGCWVVLEDATWFLKGDDSG